MTEAFKTGAVAFLKAVRQFASVALAELEPEAPAPIPAPETDSASASPTWTVPTALALEDATLGAFFQGFRATLVATSTIATTMQGKPIPTRHVGVFCGADKLASGVTDANGVAICHPFAGAAALPTLTGQYAIRAEFAGDETYIPSEAHATLTVN